jgi:RNA polymerase sigma-70 factor (ECF subfamily)
VAVSPRIALLQLNGGLGVRIDDEAGGPTLLSLVVEDGLIQRIFVMRNPHKLGRLGEETALAR